MSETVISVEHLSKSYRLGQIGTGTLTNDLQVWWAKARGKPNPLAKIGQQDRSVRPSSSGGPSSTKDDSVDQEPKTKNQELADRDSETIWALKDVTFEVKQGEVLGIIGRNGAGKSTLLKILTGVTAPTSGQIRAKGRVASLLEVGTGFHPELTGRENIYLNGAILGMKKAEITRKFDEIVAFSEVEQFIDTPVKRYSSGMYVRLAFAVAAHLDPEILLVDEVLAVGDASFQKKCLGKMGDVARGGRTVLFVSHNMPAIQHLCANGILLQNGAARPKSDARSAVQMYLAQTAILSDMPLGLRQDRLGNGQARVSHFGWHPLSLTSGVSCTFHIGIEAFFSGQLDVGIGINSTTNHPLLLFYSGHVGPSISVSVGENAVDCHIPTLPLAPGTYGVNICLQKGSDIVDWIREAQSIDVHPGDFYGSGRLPDVGQVPLLAHHSWGTLGVSEH